MNCLACQSVDGREKAEPERQFLISPFLFHGILHAGQMHGGILRQKLDASPDERLIFLRAGGDVFVADEMMFL